MSVNNDVLQDLSRENNSESMGDYSSEINDHHENQLFDDTNKQDEIKGSSNDDTSEVRQHRNRRRSSLQFLDMKLIHSLTNQFNNELNIPKKAPEDVCECE